MGKKGSQEQKLSEEGRMVDRKNKVVILTLLDIKGFYPPFLQF